MRVRLNHQFFIHHAIFQHISTVANERARARPFLTAFHIGLLNRIKREVSRQIAEPGQRFVQLHAQRFSIHRRHAERIRSSFAVDNGLGIVNTRQRRKPGER
ncbi:Uncharacterised protein [Enterobacter cloacae]|nr:Uncharacterised protein [Enterobacter cloacae]